MNHTAPPVNSPAASIAPLQNVSRCVDALQWVIDKPAHINKIACLYGRSGLGKSSAAAYSVNRFNACYIEVKVTWNTKYFLAAIVNELGLSLARKSTPIPELADMIAEELALSGRPLIIDEFDYLIDKRNGVEVVRSLYDSCKTPILIIGEQNLESKLQRWEKFHNRVTRWVDAAPANLADARHLRNLYCRQVTVADDLLTKIVNECAGNTSRIAINLTNVEEYALQSGQTRIALDDWGNRPLFNGSARRRVAS